MIVQHKDFDVVAAGHICLDIIPTIPETGATEMQQLFRAGSLLNVGPAALSTGGPVSNTGLGLVKLGCKVAFLAKVGEDEFGALIRQRLEQHGSSAGVKATAGVPSSYTVALAPPNIDRMFMHCPGANDTFSAADVDFDLVRRAGQFHLGYPPLMRSLYQRDGEELTRIFQGARQAGATTSLDLSLPDPKSASGKANWRKILAGVLPHVDVFLPSMEEAFFMLHTEDFLARKQRFGGAELLEHITTRECADMAREFLDMGAGMVALKSGYRGYYFRSGDVAAFSRMGAVRPGQPAEWAHRELWCPAFRPERIASATGSGDSSIAGFLAAFLRGLSLEVCLKSANCTGYQNLHTLDAVSGIRTWEETQGLLRDGLPIIDPKLGDASWRHDAKAELWIGPDDRG